MFNTPLDTLFLAVLMLVAAFVGTWLAQRMAARHPSPKLPEVKTESEQPQQSAPESSPASSRELDITHAFDFVDDRVTMILEMPTALLDDDAALADAWIDIVGWARMAWKQAQTITPAPEEPTSSPESQEMDESEITRDHLEDSLQRLHDAAERRRLLRQKLNEQSAQASSEA